MRIRKRLVVLFLLIIGFVAYKIYKHKTKNSLVVSNDVTYIFKDVRGPLQKTVVPVLQKTSWKKYNTGANYGIGILLTDTNSAWLGLVHAFKSFGIPFKIHVNSDSVIKHGVVLVYPIISGRALNQKSLKQLDKFVWNGGTLIGINVLGGLMDDFGFKDAVPSRENFKVLLKDKENPLLKKITDLREQEISLGSKKDFKQTIGTYGYIKTSAKPLLIYENGEACLTQYYFKGDGKSFALGIDLGEFVLRSENERGFNAQRSYVNDYEPSVDVLIRIIKNIYTLSSPAAVTLNSVPQNKDITVCITHDVDFTRSIKNAVDYAKMERSKNVDATYFIQTKYVKDWNDDIFFNEDGVACLQQVSKLGMEIASHSVAHSHIFSKFPIGMGDEKYPDYRPFVKNRDEALNGTVLGELRVSKFLLDSLVKNTNVISFRPGHLSYPFSLPQTMQAIGYKYSSSVTANNVLTHLPYQLQYNRENDDELDVFEFPVTIEDEEKPRMDLRLTKSIELSTKLSTYGGLMNVLIHTDTLGYKYTFETQLIDKLKDRAFFSSLKNFGNWWVARNGITFSVEKTKQGYILYVNTKTPISEIGFTIPQKWMYVGSDKNVVQQGEKILIHSLTDSLTIEFTVNP